MSDGTSIAWTDATWNPLVGCSRVSTGCEHCYAERLVHRGLSPQHRGLTRSTSRGPVWTGEVRLNEAALDLPLRWRKPRRIFVNSLSDLFHERVSDDWIASVFQTMATAQQHTFQVLTKRPQRMLEWVSGAMQARARVLPTEVANRPLRNVWLGVSCENQETADERIPLLLQTPAAVRFVSAEPLLSRIDFKSWLRASKTSHICADIEGMLRNRSFDGLRHDDGRPMTRSEAEDALYAIHASGVKLISAGGCDAFDPQEGCPGHPNPALDLVIVGGESGPGARPCDVEWIRDVIRQCRAAAVPCFVKQLGAKPIGLTRYTGMGRDWLRDRKGADPSQWPEDLRVQEFPKT